MDGQQRSDWSIGFRAAASGANLRGAAEDGHLNFDWLTFCEGVGTKKN
jgi:hypothetical protein